MLCADRPALPWRQCRGPMKQQEVDESEKAQRAVVGCAMVGLLPVVEQLFGPPFWLCPKRPPIT